MSLQPGTKLGSYEVVAPLGSGGMGEVYRARDAKLRREVALKVLPESLAKDADALARFEREALAVAALSHPNILAIYDFGTHDGVAYAVTELLEGETLREALSHGALAPRRAVGYAREIAEGLAAAHEKGIVHRDLKPENLFLTRDGHVKILDFGLAKQAPAPDDDVTSAPTRGKGTQPGTVMGTVGYMSPEQVRGQAVDHRSDVFSFGAVLYEMLSGKRAFHGSSAVETMNAILTTEPPELSAAGQGLPPALERLVQHCLEKKPEQRFQSARDLAFGLETLSSVPTPSRGVAAAPARAKRSLAPAAFAVALLAAGALLGRFAWKAPPPPLPSFRQLTFRLGTIHSARFAPDGVTVAYSAAWQGKPVEPYTVRVDSPESRPFGVPGAQLLGVSPAGEMALLLGATGKQHLQHVGTLARAPIGGGAPREVLENVAEADWGPDGAQLAVVRDGGGRQRLEFPPGTLVYETTGWISHPRVSPRGDLIAFLDHPVPNDDRGAVAVADRKGGGKKTLSAGWEALEGLAWSPSGEAVWFAGARSGTSLSLHEASLSGRLRTVLRGAGGVILHDVSRSGRVLIARTSERHWTMGRAPGDAKERDLSWLDSSEPYDLSADGRTLLFSEFSEAMGPNYGVCVRKTDGSAVVRLGEGMAMALSPDGKWALATLPDSRQLTLLPTGAGEPRTLAVEGVVHSFSGAFLPDGKRIVFSGREPGHAERLWVLDLAGGKPRAISPEGTRSTREQNGAEAVSPDGKLVAAWDAGEVVALYPVDGGPPRAVPGTLPGDGVVRFSADGRAIFVWEKGRLPARIFRVDLATGRREPWKELAPEDRSGVSQIYGLCLSPDGASYAYGCTRMLSDLFVVDGLR